MAHPTMKKARRSVKAADRIRVIRTDAYIYNKPIYITPKGPAVKPSAVTLLIRIKYGIRPPFSKKTLRRVSTEGRLGLAKEHRPP